MKTGIWPMAVTAAESSQDPHLAGVGFHRAVLRFRYLTSFFKLTHWVSCFHRLVERHVPF